MNTVTILKISSMKLVFASITQPGRSIKKTTGQPIYPKLVNRRKVYQLQMNYADDLAKFWFRFDVQTLVGTIED